MGGGSNPALFFRPLLPSRTSPSSILRCQWSHRPEKRTLNSSTARTFFLPGRLLIKLIVTSFDSKKLTDNDANVTAIAIYNPETGASWWLPSFTSGTYWSQRLGTRSVAATMRLELFWAALFCSQYHQPDSFYAIGPGNSIVIQVNLGRQVGRTGCHFIAQSNISCI